MRRLVSVILCIVFLVCMMAPIACAKEQEKKTIRVGWFDSLYFSKDEEGQRSGYAYDYLQKISAYEGWEYEYVEGGWTELHQMLIDGEIDVLADVNWNEEALDDMLYSSDIMGSEDFFIYISKNNKEISANDYSTLNGKTIAVVNSEIEINMLENWLEANEISANVVIVEDADQTIADDLVAGKYDAVSNVTAFDAYSTEVTPIIKYDNDTIYFAIKKDRLDIKNGIDDAMTKILANNRSFTSELYNKYFEDAGNIKSFSDEEAKWLLNHGAIKIGYRDDFLPFCKSTATGETEGFLKEFLDYTVESFGVSALKFILVPYESSEAALNAMQNGDVDCVFPMTQSPYDAETNGFSITGAVATSNLYAIVRNGESKNLNNNLRAAINKGNPDYESIVSRQYPNWSTVYFDTSEDGLKGIKNNKADCLLVISSRVNVLDELIERYDLTVINTGKSMNIGFAVKSENIELFTIMDMIANNISSDTSNLILSSVSEEENSVTVVDFIKNNMGITLMFTLFTCFIISLVVALSISNKKVTKINEELVVANNAKTDFLFNMSHDIRTPMNAILGFTGMAMRDIDDKEKALTQLKKSQVAGETLLSIINDILDTSRLESGKVVIETVKANVEKCFLDVDVVLKELARAKGVSLEFKVSKIEHKYAHVDITHVDRILTNLISNAIKYTPEGGKVLVSVEEIPCDKEGFGNYRFIVEDNGIGMSKEFQKEMFKPFTREENTTTSGIAGTGLGLALVKSFVTLLNGEIKCESEQGKGTKMILDLQFKLQEGKGVGFKREGIENNEVTLEDKKILLVEDNELNREIALDILFENGADVISAENGKDALDKLEDRGIDYFDLILMDIQMPIMNGYEATITIREKYDRHIPIIALSANAFEQDKQKSKEAGMDGHIAKPINIPEMISTISEIML